jgi:hypothetical protein
VKRVSVPINRTVSSVSNLPSIILLVTLRPRKCLVFLTPSLKCTITLSAVTSLWKLLRASLFAMNTNSGLLPASKEIRRWCSILEQELLQLSGVKMTHVFGTRAFYHRKVMFAMLPHKRTLEGSAVISFIRTENNSEPNWQTFELTGHNLDDAMVLLEQAYRLSVLRPFTGFRRLRASVYSAIKIGNRESMYAVR